MYDTYRYVYKKPRDPWYGLWWIVLFMYTHVVHTSMSILNCPILPGRSGDHAPVSTATTEFVTWCCTSIYSITLELSLVKRMETSTFAEDYPVLVKLYRICFAPQSCAWENHALPHATHQLTEAAIDWAILMAGWHSSKLWTCHELTGTYKIT